MGRPYLLCAVLLAGMLLCGVVFAKTINVPTDYATVQGAIDAANTGDVVVLAAGTYNENIDFKAQEITVRSTLPTDSSVVGRTIINGGALDSTVKFVSGEDSFAVLSGVTVTNGKAAYGGGILCSASSPTISYCRVRQNNAQLAGGGIACLAGSAPKITNCTIAGNSADCTTNDNNNHTAFGGGIWCSSSSPLITTNAITGNTAQGRGWNYWSNSWAWGGGIEVEGGSPSITGNTLTSNVTVAPDNNNGGGGILLDSAAGALVSANTITGNSTTSGGDGGGIYLMGSSSMIQNNVLNGNSARRGAGVYCDGNAPGTMTGNQFVSNAANSAGGGICTDTGAAIVNNSFFGNSAPTGAGGGISCGNANPTIVNCIVFGSTGGSGIQANSAIAVSYTDVYGNTGGNYAGFTDPTGTNGNISKDPLFFSASTGNLRLKSQIGHWSGTAWVADSVTSPCIDAGDPDSAYAKEPAPNGGRINLGYDGNTVYASKSLLLTLASAAEYVDSKHVKLTFSLPMSSTTANVASHYVISPTLGVSAAAVQTDTTKVLLTTTDPQTATQKYKVTVTGVKSVSGLTISSTANTATWTAGNPVPTVVSATYLDLTHVNVLFNEAMDATTVNTATNYAIAPTVAVSSAVLQSDNKTVKLTTGTQALSTTYTVTATGVKEVGGILIGSTGNTGTWKTPNPVPTVVSATYVDTTHVNVLFSEAMDVTTCNTAANYAVPSLSVTAAALQSDNKTVKLTTGTQALSTTYTVTVSGVKEVGGVLIGSTGNSKSWTTPNGGPKVVSAKYVDLTHAKVLFDKAMDPTTANGAAHYAISPTLSVTGAALQSDTKTVLLTIATQALNTTYTVTVSGVKEAGGILIGATGNSAKWNSPPTVSTDAVFVDVNHVKVVFGEAMGPTSSSVAANYVITPTLNVTAAVLQSDKKTVILTTDTMGDDVDYSVTISNVKEVAGVVIDPGHNTAVWNAPALPPTVIANTPTGTNATAQSTVIGVTFSVPMNHTTAQAAFSISPTATGTFSWVGNQMLYTIKYALAPTTAYTVTIANTASSANAMTMVSPFSWSFTTNNVPAIAFHSPTGTAVPLLTNRVIQILFNEPMDQAATQAAFSLSPSVAGNFSWYSPSELDFTFTAACAPLTTYTVSLAATAKSLGGVTLAAPYSWTFKTGAASTGTVKSLAAAAVATSNGAEIVVELTSTANVAVSIRNLAGRQIALLAPKQLDAGVHSLLWNGRSATGTKVPSGTYLVEVKAAGADGSSRSVVSSLQR